MNLKQNWIVTFGNAEINGSTVIHVPTRMPPSAGNVTAPEGERKSSPPHTFLRSNVEFEQGVISWEAFLVDGSDTCLLMLPAEPSLAQGTGTAAESTTGNPIEFELLFGLNCLGAPYGCAMLRNWNWEPVIGVGHGSFVPTNRWIPISAHVFGSTIDIYVDGIRIVSTNKTLRRGQVGLFMQGSNSIKFRNLKIEAQQPLCFAVMQFTEDFNILYKDVIKPVCEEFGYRTVRGDDFYTSGQILEDITQSIRSAALIIADVTPDNANVFYEVGYAHGIGKPTILLSDRTRQKLPFDISGFRTLFYDNTIGGKAAVEQRLRQHLEAIRTR